jgi:hypothetical protein
MRSRIARAAMVAACVAARRDAADAPALARDIIGARDGRHAVREWGAVVKHDVLRTWALGHRSSRSWGPSHLPRPSAGLFCALGPRLRLAVKTDAGTECESAWGLDADRRDNCRN